MISVELFHILFQPSQIKNSIKYRCAGYINNIFQYLVNSVKYVNKKSKNYNNFFLIFIQVLIRCGTEYLTPKPITFIKDHRQFSLNIERILEN